MTANEIVANDWIGLIAMVWMAAAAAIPTARLARRKRRPR